MSNSDAVYTTNKNIQYARYFVRNGRKDDAQRRLRQAFDIALEATKSRAVATATTNELMRLMEVIEQVWQESRAIAETPRASSFVATPVRESDAVYSTKKSIGYAQYFIKAGRKSDAQRKLRQAMASMEDATRERVTATAETNALVELLEDIYVLWQMSAELQ